MSTGDRVSYRLGAWHIMATVPLMHAIVNTQRKNLSKIIATNFQSSITCETKQTAFNDETLFFHKKVICISEICFFLSICRILHVLYCARRYYMYVYTRVTKCLSKK